MWEPAPKTIKVDRKESLSIRQMEPAFSTKEVDRKGTGKNPVNNDGSSVIREELEEWPDNDYTRAIIKPVTGTMDYVLHDEEAGYYAVFLNNITLEDGKKYIQLLQKNGFETVSSDSNFVATGELLQRENVVVGVSASENVLAVYISLNAEKYNL